MTNAIMRLLVALGTGGLFGFGLSLSGMLDPKRVRGFLDVFGNFDPSLAFVLVAAVSVSAAGYLLSRRMREPLFERCFHLPAQRRIDRRLIEGAAVFGIGWGMSGLCPGLFFASLFLGGMTGQVFFFAVDYIDARLTPDVYVCTLTGMAALAVAIIGAPLAMSFRPEISRLPW